MNVKKIIFHKITLISLLAVLLVGFAYYGITTIQRNRNHHDAFIGDIEDLYYYLKKEPFKMETYGILRQGDSVAMSAWQNIISTSETRVRQYERMIVEHLADNSHYGEIELLKKLGEGLVLFKELCIENRERVESDSEYSTNEYENRKQQLQELLKEVLEMDKEHKLDLR